MDINSRIKWTPGMELTAKTFSALDDNFDLRQLVSVRTANGLRIGRLPGAAFSANGVFVRGSFEIERLQCMALLSSGMIISVDEPLTLELTPQTEKYFYLTIGFGAEMISYEANDQEYVRPTYAYELHTLSEIDRMMEDALDSVFPIIRFVLDEGRVLVDKNFIPPCLIVETDARLSVYLKQIIEKLEQVVNHPNMSPGDGQRSLLHYLFQLRSLSTRNTLECLMLMLQETANTIDYHIETPHDPSRITIPEWTQYDPERWLSWFLGYLDKVLQTLQTVVLEDDSIDYEKLKSELRNEILEMIRPEMEQRVEAVRVRLNDELEQKLSYALRDYIDGTFRAQIHDTLHTELTDELRQPLYDGLYQALYEALYVPVQEEEDNFMPLI